MKFTPHQVKEVNSLIEKIEKAIKPGYEIGAQSKPILNQLLTTNSINKKPIFFDSKREYANTIVSYFVNEKKVARSRFDSNTQASIFILPD